MKDLYSAQWNTGLIKYQGVIAADNIYSLTKCSITR
jgi:hypothetical protein